MDERTLDDADGADGADGVRPRRHGTAVRVGVALLALCVAAASVLAWELVSAGGGSAGGRHGHGHEAAGRTTPGTTAPRTTAPATTAPATTAPAAAATGPIRVAEIGDSLGVDLGEAMQSTWPASRVLLTMAARGDTGLTNSGYYDWPVELSKLLSSAHPQVVIVLLGANDLQNMVTGSEILDDGTPAWNAAYAARVTRIVSESVRAGADVLWIGEPAMQTAFINAGMTRIDGIAMRVTARYPGRAAYLNADAVLAPGGTFTFDVTTPTGDEVQVRTPDGVHLMPAGAELLAGAAAGALAVDWGMQVIGP